VLDDVLHPDDPAPLAVFHVDDVRVVPSPPR
jgi:hypothetical protein